MGRLAGIQLGALARVIAAAVCCLALAHCSGSFSSKEYSPRVVEEGEPVPKGGGMRLDGYDVLFLTGTDEHGSKMLQTAAKEKLSPQQLVERNVPRFKAMREAHKLADEHEDVATASLLENFIDEAEKRCWFLFEASRAAERTGH